jgi:hypothetical protein
MQLNTVGCLLPLDVVRDTWEMNKKPRSKRRISQKSPPLDKVALAPSRVIRKPLHRPWAWAFGSAVQKHKAGTFVVLWIVSPPSKICIIPDVKLQIKQMFLELKSTVLTL